MQKIINGRDIPSYLDGDWEVNWSFQDYLISTSVMANNADEALRRAEAKLPWLIKEEDYLSLSIELMGVYGGYELEDEVRK